LMEELLDWDVGKIVEKVLSLMRSPSPFVLIVLLLFLAACSGSRPVEVEERGPREPTFEEVLEQLPSTESFDASAYPTPPPVVDVEVEHDVPEALMKGIADGGVSGQQRGYRIQVVFAREKDTADQAVEAVHQWLQLMREENPGQNVFQLDLPVHNIYLQPYFRVRVGDFSNKETAEELLNLMIDEYPNAFIVADQVDTGG